MSKFVDERVVEMSFDNKKFESNVKTSMGTIDKLKSSLDFSGTANSINKQLDGVNTNGLVAGMMNVKNSFTAWEIASIAAIANITNRVIDLGIQMVKSLSTDQISSGWAKFGESAVNEATLLAQGFSQADVTKTLEKLMWYSDETSYSFTDMLNNMSKFTATGKGLEESSRAMMGIANWAALSGQNSTTASRAMYQLSQAMAQGNVRLMDYKSIQNANMDTEEFRKTVLKTAVSMGQLYENVDGTFTTLTGKTFSIGQFTTELDELWFTSDVLMSSLDKYASGANKIYDKIAEDSDINTAAEAIKKYGDELGDLEKRAFLAAQEARTFKDAIVAVKDAVASGWMNVFNNIFGNVAEAKVLWSDLANELYTVFMDGMWTKIDILGLWAENGGRDDLFANTEENTGAFWNLLEALVAIKNLISGAWTKVFGFSQLEEYDDRVSDIATKLKSFTANLKEWTKGLILSKETTEVLTNVLTGFFSIIKAGFKLVGALWKGIQPLVQVIKSFAMVIIGLLSNVGKSVTGFVQTTTIFDKIANTLSKFFTTIINFVKSLELLKGLKIMIDAVGTSFRKALGGTKTQTENLSFFRIILDSLGKAFKWLGDIITKYVVPVLPKFFEIIGTGVGWLAGTIVKLFGSLGKLINRFKEWASTNQTFQNGMNWLKKVLFAVGNAFKSLWNNIVGFFSSFGKVNTKPVDEFTEDVEEKFNPLKSFLEGLSNLFQGLWHVVKAILPAIGALFGLIGKALTFVGNKLKEIFTHDDGSVNFQKIFSVAFWSVIAVGIYRLATMLRSITSIFRDAFDGLFDFVNSKTMMQYMEAMRTMAISVLLLVGALVILGMMDTATLVKAGIALAVLISFIVGVMIAMKSLVMTNFSKIGKEITGTKSSLTGLGFAFLGLGLAVLMLVWALKSVSKLDPKELMYGLLVIATLMTMMAVLMRAVGKADKQTNKAVKSMVKMAISISLLAVPLKRIGSMDTKVAVKGLIGIAALMMVLTLYSRFSKPIDKAQRPINGLLTTAIALTLLTIPLKIIGKMNWLALGKSFSAILALFTILVLVSKVMKLKDVNRLKVISGQLVKVAFGLVMFGFSMLILGLNSWESIAKAIVTIVGVFVALTLLSKFLTAAKAKSLSGLVKTLLPLSIGLMAFGLAMRSIGGIPWAKILKSLATVTAVLTILTLFGAIIKKAGSSNGQLALLGLALIVLSAGLLVLSVALLALGNISLETLGIGLLAVVAVFVVFGVAALLLKPIIPILLALAGTFAIFAVSVFLLVTAMTMLVAIMTVSAAAFAAGLMALAGAVIIASPLIMQALWEIVKGLLELFIKALPLIGEALTNLVLELLNVLKNTLPKLMETLVDIITRILDALGKLIPKVLETLMTLIFSLLDSLIENLPKIVDKLITLFIGVIQGLTKRLPELLMEMSKLIGAFVDGAVAAIVALVPKMVNAGFDLIIGLLDGIGNTMKERAGELREAIVRFAQNIWQAFLNFFGIHSPSTKFIEAAGHMISGLLKGLWDGLVGLISNIGKWVGEILGAIGKFFGKAVEAGANLMNNIAKGAQQAWNATKNWFSNTAKSIGGFFSDVGKGIVSTGKNIIEGVKNGASAAWNGTKNFFTNAASSIGGFFSGAVNGMKSVGSNLINGLKGGMESAGNTIKNTVTNVANKVTGWFKGVFGIHSPSRVFAEMGMFLDLGLAQGINDYSGKVYNASENLADDTIEGFERANINKAISSMIDAFDSDFSNEIVITPVMDLSEIQNGKTQLGNMMGNMGKYSIDGSNNMAYSTRDDINTKPRVTNEDSAGNSKSTSTPVTGSEVINNTFNITGSNPKEIADEVSKILQNDVDRRKAKNGNINF